MTNWGRERQGTKLTPPEFQQRQGSIDRMVAVEWNKEGWYL